MMQPAGFPVDPAGGSLVSASSLARAVACLQEGGIVAFPTETYYGLAADPFSEKALQALFHLKARDYRKPVLVLIHDDVQLGDIAESIPDMYRPLMDRFWPGPLTLIFPGRKDLLPLLTGGTGTIGVRISSNVVAMELCRRWGRPITATSANLSGLVPAISAEEVETMLGPGVDFILDGGRAPAGRCSSIVAIRDDRLCLIREGQIDFSLIIEGLKE